MQIFSDDWVRHLHKQYADQPTAHRPRIYWVATQPEQQPTREEIDAWVAALPAAKQGRVVAKLRAPQQFLPTYHQLVVGHILHRFGYHPEYQATLAPITPDWFVGPQEGIPAFIVETVPAAPRESEARRARPSNPLLRRLAHLPRVLAGIASTHAWRARHDPPDDHDNELFHALASIPRDVVLVASIQGSGVVLDPQQIRSIAAGVGDWLTRDQPQIGAAYELQGLIFDVVAIDTGVPRVDCRAAPTASFVDLPTFTAQLAAKAHAYSAAGPTQALPVVVSVVADPHVGRGRLHFLDVVLAPEPSGTMVSQQMGALHEQSLPAGEGDDRVTGGRIQQVLSAGLWVWKDATGDWRAHIIHNPEAVHPLPTETFER